MMQTELAIVGGGPAGLAAAIEAARRDVQVTLVDLGDQPGGALSLQTHRYDGLAGMAIGALLWRAAEARASRCCPRTLAWGLFEDRTLGLAIDHGTGRERSAILAGGARADRDRRGGPPARLPRRDAPRRDDGDCRDDRAASLARPAGAHRPDRRRRSDRPRISRSMRAMRGCRSCAHHRRTASMRSPGRTARSRGWSVATRTARRTKSSMPM